MALWASCLYQQVKDVELTHNESGGQLRIQTLQDKIITGKKGVKIENIVLYNTQR